MQVITANSPTTPPYPISIFLGSDDANVSRFISGSLNEFNLNLHFADKVDSDIIFNDLYLGS